MESRNNPSDSTNELWLAIGKPQALVALDLAQRRMKKSMLRPLLAALRPLDWTLVPVEHTWEEARQEMLSRTTNVPDTRNYMKRYIILNRIHNRTKLDVRKAPITRSRLDLATLKEYYSPPLTRTNNTN